MPNPRQQLIAVQDFDRLRERAILQDLLAALTRAPLDLLSYEEIRRKLHIWEVGERGLKDIPIANIVGSVGRYRDFTRTFLPRRASSRHRWVRIMTLAEGLFGWPPIEVFQVGDVYFVKDGNHRVSVAKAMGMKTIEAYVTECQARVPLTADMTATDLIIQADYADFLEYTHLDRLRPAHSIKFTAPGRYQDLLAHIAAHQYYLDQRSAAPVAWEEAVTSWYDQVYVPLIRLIREQGLLAQFPHRTESDLVAWLIRHQWELRRACAGAEVDDNLAIHDFAERYSGRPVLAQLKAAQRFVRRVMHLDRPPCHN